MQDFFYSPNLTLRDQRYHLIAQQSTLFSSLLIIGLVILFKIYEVSTLFYLGVVLSILLLGCLWLNKKHYYLGASAIHTLVMLIFFGAGVVTLGWESGMQYPLITQAIVVQFSNKESSSFRLIAGLILLVAFLLLAFNFSGEPSPFLLPENILELLFYVNIIMSFLTPLLSLNNFGTTLIRAEDNLELVNVENEKLLYSIFPVAIANSLKIEKKGIVHRYDSVSILFADLVGFTTLFEESPPQRVVDLLNNLFSRFDDLTDKYGIEKVKTIGDAYMVAAGVPNAKVDHAKVIFTFAQEMLYQVEVFNEGMGTQLKLRIGISSGSVIAGVIGKKKFNYDMWGDTVNTAARMEAFGQAGAIQISPSTYEILKDEFEFEKVEGIEIKGKGNMDVYLWRP